MQHQFAKPLHRSTEWRRNKRGGNGRLGRRWASDYEDKGFLGFAAIVISLINQNGSVGYAELEKTDDSGNRAYRKDKMASDIFTKLADSGFPPAMLAVAACMIGKLNCRTRRGAKPTKTLPHEKAFLRLKESGDSITVRNWESALRREKLEIVLRRHHTKKADRNRFIAEAEKSGFKDEWVMNYLKEYQTPVDRRVKDLEPSAVSSKGTPPQSIDYIHGAKLTRQMASYWRKHRRFPDCLKFLKPLLTRELPRVPSDIYYQMPYDYYVNGEIDMFWRVRKLEKQNQDMHRAKKDPGCPACFGQGVIACPKCHVPVACIIADRKIIGEVETDEKTGNPVNCKVCGNRRIIHCEKCKKPAV